MNRSFSEKSFLWGEVPSLPPSLESDCTYIAEIRWLCAFTISRIVTPGFSSHWEKREKKGAWSTWMKRKKFFFLLLLVMAMRIFFNFSPCPLWEIFSCLGGVFYCQVLSACLIVKRLNIKWQGSIEKRVEPFSNEKVLWSASPFLWKCRFNTWQPQTFPFLLDNKDASKKERCCVPLFFFFFPPTFTSSSAKKIL